MRKLCILSYLLSLVEHNGLHKLLYGIKINKKTMGEIDNEVVKKRIHILLEAIKDTQGIIGRLDTKARFYLAIYLAILGGHLAFLVRVIEGKIEKNFFLFLSLIIGLIIVGLTVWLMYLVSVKVISPKSNPIASIKNLPPEFRNTIFYPMSFCFNEFLNKLNSIQNLEDVEKILAVELLKVSVIREEKIRALNEIERFHKPLGVLIFMEFLLLFFRVFIKSYTP